MGYAKRNSMISSAYDAGKVSRWGDLEERKTVTYTFNNPYDNYNDFPSTNKNTVLSNNRMKSILYAKRNSMISSAFDAGKVSRWGDLEERKTVTYTSNNAYDNYDDFPSTHINTVLPNNRMKSIL